MIKKLLSKLHRATKIIGPGLITGAADDDPSGIATYSLAGARFGYETLWTALLTFPLMIAVQETCARIGLVTKSGLARVLKNHYPRPVLVLIGVLLLIANTFNIGADLVGIAASVSLIFPIPEKITMFAIAAIISFLTIALPYKKIAAIFKWLALSLLTYLLVFLIVERNYSAVLRQTLLPNLQLFTQKEYLLMILAIFGTTISPYLFFWQAGEEAEEVRVLRFKVNAKRLGMEREDTIFGMLFSNLATFFIIGSCGATLNLAGLSHIETAAQAAMALRPLAGDFASVLFTLGILGTGFLAIPILASSAAYTLTEIFNLKEGLNISFQKAKIFYLCIVGTIFLGLLINLFGFPPMKALFYSAVLNGLIAPVLIGIIVVIANNRAIMGSSVNGKITNLLSVITILIMSLVTIFAFVL